MSNPMSLEQLPTEELIERERFVKELLSQTKKELRLKQNYTTGSESVAGLLVEGLEEHDLLVVRACEWGLELAKRLEEASKDSKAMDELAKVCDQSEATCWELPDVVCESEFPHLTAQIAKRKQT